MMPSPHADIHAAGACLAALGGAIVAQATQSPAVTAGAIALAGIGLASLWVRSYYGYLAARLEHDRRADELRSVGGAEALRLRALADAQWHQVVELTRERDHLIARINALLAEHCDCGNPACQLCSRPAPPSVG